MLFIVLIIPYNYSLILKEKRVAVKSSLKFIFFLPLKESVGSGSGENRDEFIIYNYVKKSRLYLFFSFLLNSFSFYFVLISKREKRAI